MKKSFGWRLHILLVIPIFNFDSKRIWEYQKEYGFKNQYQQWKGLLWISFAAIDNERKGSKKEKMSRFKFCGT